MRGNQLQPCQVRSGQVRVFNVYIQSKLLLHTPVTGTGTGLHRFLCTGQEIKRWEVVRGDHLHWRVQGSMSSSTGIGSRRRVVWGVMEFGMSRRITPKRERERNVLFNDALNTFYLRLYGVRHMVKDHSDSERKPAAAT